MKIKTFAFIVLLFASTTLHAQYEDARWILGDYAQLNFMSPPNTPAPNGSHLFIRNSGLPYEPLNNFASPGLPNNIYSTTSPQSIFNIGNQAEHLCPGCNGCKQATNPIITTLEKVAQDSIDFSNGINRRGGENNGVLTVTGGGVGEIVVVGGESEGGSTSIDSAYIVAAKQWLAKMQLLELLAWDDSTNWKDSSSILYHFYNEEVSRGNRYPLLAIMNTLAIDSTTDEAQSMLDSYTPTCDNETMYKNLLQVAINIRNNTTTATDSALVTDYSDACTTLYGEVVYQARVLYGLLYEELKTFDDTCGSAAANASRVKNETKKVNQNLITTNIQFEVYPNPNDGKFFISYNANYEGRFKIVNPLGQTIKIITCSNQETQEVSLNGFSGLLIIQLVNKEGQIVGSKKVFINEK